MLGWLVFALLCGSGWADNRTWPSFDGADFSYDGLFASAVFPTSSAASDPAKAHLFIGTGVVKVNAGMCHASMGSCAGPVLPVGVDCVYEQGEFEVTASGTLFAAKADGLVCCDAATEVASANETCVRAVLVTPQTADSSVIVGTFTQLHRPDVQILVADYMGFPRPYAYLLVCSAAGAVYFAIRGRSGNWKQHALDSTKYTFALSLGVSCAADLLLMVNHGIQSFDLVEKMAKISGVLLSLLCFCHKNSMRNFLGDDAVRCFCQKAAWSTGTYGFTGNIAAALPLLQGALNGALRTSGARGSAYSNNRAP
jgi:hypothetical protein